MKPIDKEAVIAAGKTGNIVVAQDHSVIGGLGEAVATTLAKNKIITNLEVKGTPDEYFVMGHAPWLYHQFEYDADGLYKTMKNMVRG